MATKDDEQFISLETLMEGAAVEKFQTELDAVLENILDPNTKPEAVREITLKLKIKPKENRKSADVSVLATSKLAPAIESKTVIFIGRKQNRAVAAESDMRQMKLEEKTGPVALRGGGGNK